MTKPNRAAPGAFASEKLTGPLELLPDVVRREALQVQYVALLDVSLYELVQIVKFYGTSQRVEHSGFTALGYAAWTMPVAISVENLPILP